MRESGLKKVLAIVLIVVAVATIVTAWARSPWGQGVREHFSRVAEDLAEEWADSPPTASEVLQFRVARLIVALIDFMD